MLCVNVVYKEEIRFLVSLKVVPTKDNDGDKNILILSSPHKMNYYSHALPDPKIFFKLVGMQIWDTTLIVNPKDCSILYLYFFHTNLVN